MFKMDYASGHAGLAVAPQNTALKTRRPHICFVAPEAWPVFSGNTEINVVGGAEVQQSILARLLVQAGYRVSMICLNYGQAPQESIDGVSIHRVYHPDAGLPGLRFIHPRLTSMWQVMKAVDADVYYQRTASMLTGIVAAFCRQHRKFSIYAGASDPDFVPGRQQIRFRRDRWLYEKGLAWASQVVVQNKTQQVCCLKHYGRQAEIIPSCYELPKTARSRSGQSVLWVGMLRQGKRPALFLELAKRLPQFHFIMIGGAGGEAAENSHFDALREEAQALPNFEFTGFLPLNEVEPYFDRAAILVNTSAFEGVPTTFLQAWARGIPTVAFVDIGARLHGEAIYPVVQTVDAAVQEIERLFADPSYQQQAGQRCREYFALTHSPTGILAKYETLLAELLTAGKP